MKNFIFIVAGFLAGCASMNLTPKAREEMQVKTMGRMSPANVMKAAQALITEQGGFVTSQDLDGGLLVATLGVPANPMKTKTKRKVKVQVEKEEESSDDNGEDHHPVRKMVTEEVEEEVEVVHSEGIFWPAMGRKPPAPGTDRVQVLVNIRQNDNKETEARVSFQHLVKPTLGAAQGSEILIPEVYRIFFEQLQLELEGKRLKQTEPAKG